MSFTQKIYSRLPVYGQNICCSLYGIKAQKQRYGNVFDERLSSLRESQNFTKNEIAEFQNEQLRLIISHAVSTVPYYSSLFKSLKLTSNDIRTVEDLSKLPILTKEDVRKNWIRMVSSEVDVKKLIHSHTSGSTGTALDFYLDSSTIQFQWATWWRFRERFGITYGDKHLNFTGKLVVPIGQKTPPYWRKNRPLNQFLVNMQHILPQNIKYFVELINKEQFSFFSGYPSIIYAFCQRVEEMGLSIENGPKVVFTGAEKLYDNQRSVIQRVLNCLVVDHYGFSEAAGNASRCKRDVFHEDFEFGLLEPLNVEKIDNSDYSGDIVATGFANYAMPLIRYKVGDTAVWSDIKCECGLESRVLKNIEGRSEDYVITPEGGKILRFDYLFKDTVDIKECQIVQRKLGQVILRVVKRNNYSVGTEQKLRKLVGEWISPTIEVIFEYPREIERTSAGKFRAVVSELNSSVNFKK